MIGFDPIALEFVNVKEWLDMDKQNIAIFNDDDSKIYCLNKRYFAEPNIADVYLKCFFNNGQLDVKDTYTKNQAYKNIGKYLNGHAMIRDDHLKQILKDKKPGKEPNLFTFSKTETEQVISVNYLELSNIEFAKIQNKKQDGFKKNFPFKFDFYFDQKIKKALHDYSIHWDQAMNLYLRYGDDYFNTQLFQGRFHRYGSTLDAAIQNVKDKIIEIDQCFLLYAPRVPSVGLRKSDFKGGVVTDFFFHRGMKNGYPAITKDTVVGDKFIVKNFTSISREYGVAKRFASSTCCIYRIELESGLPFIDVSLFSRFKAEKEVLLPRNIQFTVKEINEINSSDLTVPSIQGTKILITLRASATKDQFAIDSGCKTFAAGKLSSISIQMLKDKISDIHGEDVDELSEWMDELQLQDTTEETPQPATTSDNPTPTSAKLVRCPKGQRRNKKTGECEYHITIEDRKKLNQVTLKHPVYKHFFKNIEWLDVPRDNHCFFHAFAKGVNLFQNLDKENEYTAGALRSLAANHLEKVEMQKDDEEYKEFYNQIKNIVEVADGVESISQYISNIREGIGSAGWGSEIELLALSCQNEFKTVKIAFVSSVTKEITFIRNGKPIDFNVDQNKIEMFLGHVDDHWMYGMEF